MCANNSETYTRGRFNSIFSAYGDGVSLIITFRTAILVFCFTSASVYLFSTVCYGRHPRQPHPQLLVTTVLCILARNIALFNPKLCLRLLILLRLYFLAFVLALSVSLILSFE
jgi:hypothetical protein